MAEVKIYRPAGMRKDRGRLLIASSAYDLLEHCQRGMPDQEEATLRRLSSQELDRGESWDLGVNWSGAAELVRTGWHNGTADVLARVDAIEHAYSDQFAGYQFDVTGRFFDVGLVVAGEPECWLQEDYQPVRKTCRMQVNIMTGYNVPVDMMLNRGAAIVALIDRLQQAGWIVDLSVYAVGAGHRNADQNTVSVLRVDIDTRPIDVDAVSVLVAHPAGYRRLGFAAYESINNYQDMGSYGGGSLSVKRFADCDMTTSQAQEFFELCTGGAVASDAHINLLDSLQRGDYQFATPESAAAWVKQQVEKITAS